MKKGLSFVVAVLTIFLAASSQAELMIDVSRSDLEIIGTDKIRINNLTAPGYPGNYWAEFQWDPKLLTFSPVNAGQVNGKVWTLQYHDSLANSAIITVRADSDDPSIRLLVRPVDGGIYACFSRMKLKQGNQQISLDTNALRLNSQTALFIPKGWSGCDTLSAGTVAEAALSQIPTWFDPRSPFIFVFDQGREYELR